MAGFAILVVEGLNKLYQRIHAINFGIYGATQAGKTTLNNQLRTRGEVPDIKTRTVGLERATRKFIKLDGDAHTVKTADIGGQTVYWNDWINDMRKRHVKYIIFMLDDRHMDKHFDIEQQLCWTFLVDTICAPEWNINGKRKTRGLPVDLLNSAVFDAVERAHTISTHNEFSSQWVRAVIAKVEFVLTI